MPDNTLYYGDNLDILRRYVADESVDLVYLDPPFNSNANYNVLFKEHSGEQAQRRRCCNLYGSGSTGGTGDLGPFAASRHRYSSPDSCGRLVGPSARSYVPCR